MSNRSQRRITTIVIFLSLIVIAWRITALLRFLGKGDAGALSDVTVGLMAALGAMGFLFVVSGLFAWLKLRTEIAALFALYCIFYGMHWGGVISAQSIWLENSFRLLHLVLSGILSQAFLLHFSAVFFAGAIMHRQRFLVFVLYAPAAVAVGVMMIAIAVQDDALCLKELEDLLQLFETIFTNAYFLASALVIWIGWIASDSASRCAKGISLVAGGLFAAILPYLASIIVSAVAPAPWIYKFGSAPYTLFFSLIPISFLFALLRKDQHRKAAV